MMHYPGYRPRRLRRNDALRRLTREARLPVDSFVNPVFAVPGRDVKKTIQSMPGNFEMPVDNIVREARGTKELGIRLCSFGWL